MGTTAPTATANFAGSTLKEVGEQITLSAITGTAGTISSSGVEVVMPASGAIVTGGTMNGLLVTAPTTSGPAAGTMNGVNIANLTSAGAGTENAILIGSGWDTGIATPAGVALAIDSGTTGGINIGTGANAKTITIGNQTGASAITLDSGTGAIDIGRTIAKTITIGNGTGATALALTSGTGSQTFTSSVATGTTTTSAMVLTDSSLTSGTLLYLNPATGQADSALVSAAGQVSLTPSQTIASASGATWNGITVPASTATISGSTNITTSTGFNLVNLSQPTLSAGTALTVTNAATLSIANAPTGGGAGPATITSPYALWIDDGLARFDGTITSAAGAALTIDSGTTGAIDIGTGANAKTITIGNATSTTSVVVNAGTGNIDIGTGAQARAINLGTGAAAQTIIIGANNTTASTTLRVGRGNSALAISNTAPADVSGATSTDASTSLIGITAAQGGNTTITTTGAGGIGSAIAWTLGTGGTAAGANTASTGGAGGAFAVTSGTGGAAAATGTNTGGAGGALALTGGTGGAGSGGSSNTGGVGGTITLLAGAAGSGGNVNGGTLTLNSGAPTGTGTSTLNLGSSNATNLNVGTAAVADTITIGNSTGATSIALNSGTGTSVTIGNNSVAHTITIGNSTGATALNFTSGTGSQTHTSSVATGTTTTSAFVLTDTALTSGTLLDMDISNTSGTAINLRYPSAATLAGTVTGQAMDLSTNVTATDQSVAGINITLPAATNTATNVITYRGLVVTGGAISYDNTTPGKSTVFRGVDVTIPALTQVQTNGIAGGSGISIATGSITTGGTEQGVFINASGVGAGTLHGINISAITAGAGTENAITIGSGWDKQINGNNWSVDNNGAITAGGTSVTHTLTGMLCVKNTTSCPTQSAGRLYVDTAGTASDDPGDVFDLAEFYPASEPVEAGDVLTVDQSQNVHVRKASSGYQTALIGVASKKPAVAIEESWFAIGGVQQSDPLKPLVALVGRVPVKVTDENGPIAPGDRLTSSATRHGYAMKATKPGMTLGIALESLASSTGKVRTWVNVSWWDGGGATLTATQSSQGAITVPTNDMTLNGYSLLDVRAIASASGSWKIAEDGMLTVRGLTVGTSDHPSGITLYDEDGGAPYCVSVKGGSVVTRSGVCGSAPASVSNSAAHASSPVPEITAPHVSAIVSAPAVAPVPAPTETITPASTAGSSTTPASAPGIAVSSESAPANTSALTPAPASDTTSAPAPVAASAATPTAP